MKTALQSWVSTVSQAVLFFPDKKFVPFLLLLLRHSDITLTCHPGSGNGQECSNGWKEAKANDSQVLHGVWPSIVWAYFHLQCCPDPEMCQWASLFALLHWKVLRSRKYMILFPHTTDAPTLEKGGSWKQLRTYLSLCCRRESSWSGQNAGHCHL